MKRAMQKRRSISFMAWVTVLAIIAIGAAVNAVPMTEAQFTQQMEEAIQRDREEATLAAALFAEARYRAQEVNK